MIPLFSPSLPKESGQKVKEVIDSGLINRGKYSDELEKKLREKYNMSFVHLVNSCTSALKISLKIAGIKPGDEVISTPWTMVATNTAILECGAKPIFVDIDYDTLNIDASLIESRITSRTKAIMVVYYAGYPAEMHDIYGIARKNHLEVIQDAAQALGAKYRSKWIGSFGHFTCFSFQTIKTITMGEGGAISTNMKSIYDDIVKRSWFGIDKGKRIKTSWGSFPEDINVLGYKANTTDINAALGLVGLNHIDEALKRRKEIALRYFEELGNLDRITLLNYSSKNGSSFWIFPLHVENRARFAKTMLEAGIEVSKHNERNDKYTIFGGIQDLPNTKRVNDDIIHIPIHMNLSDENIEYIIKKIREWSRT